MDKNVFLEISKIIERDSKATTYKFALLRGTIDIIQENSPYVSFSDNKAIFPVGLLIEKWLIYYYPILESNESIPQIYGKAQLTFYNQFQIIIKYYRSNNGLSGFYNDLRNEGIPSEIRKEFIQLSKKLKETILKMPMRYIGRSVSNDYYSIFKIEDRGKKSGKDSIDTNYLIDCYGRFSIPLEYYDAFKILGTFLSGQDSILFKWAEFSVNASGKKLSTERVLNDILKYPVTEKDVKLSKKLYKSILIKSGEVECVWTGNKLSKYDIDHVIPFSIWKNNDLWNLFPSDTRTNNKKRDKIPSPILLERRKDLIIHYWEIISEYQKERFFKELNISLLGEYDSINWKNSAFTKFKENCNYLINTRGYEEWVI